jgi:DNA-binding beta-propeller fold protein YncE
MKRLMAGVLTVCLATMGASAPATAGSLREVLLVGNNWDGTVDVIQPGGGFEKVKRFNVIPDRSARISEIMLDPVRLAYFLGIRRFIGEGHDQFVDDIYTSRDGRLLVVSRPSFGDVVALATDTGRIVWRFRVAGYRADHMALSPDGQRVAVSASTGNVVHVLEVATGREIGRFSSGDSPHANVYSKDGSRIFHASIGAVYTPLDEKWADSTKGERVFQIVDAGTLQVIKRIDIRAKLDEAGYPQLSQTVRPMTFSADERLVYFQVSFHHGFVEYDLAQDRVTRVALLPVTRPEIPREEYVLDSAHHGIAMNPQGTKLCVAGTMSDYATIVSPQTFLAGPLIAGSKPYWAMSDAAGRYCFVSFSGEDRIAAISYETGTQVVSVPVGDHPQRMRFGYLP